jgi:hypothetical protein
VNWNAGKFKGRVEKGCLKTICASLSEQKYLLTGLMGVKYQGDLGALLFRLQEMLIVKQAQLK